MDFSYQVSLVQACMRSDMDAVERIGTRGISHACAMRIIEIVAIKSDSRILTWLAQFIEFDPGDHRLRARIEHSVLAARSVTFAVEILKKIGWFSVSFAVSCIQTSSVSDITSIAIDGLGDVSIIDEADARMLVDVAASRGDTTALIKLKDRLGGRMPEFTDALIFSMFCSYDDAMLDAVCRIFFEGDIYRLQRRILSSSAMGDITILARSIARDLPPKLMHLMKNIGGSI